MTTPAFVLWGLNRENIMTDNNQDDAWDKKDVIFEPCHLCGGETRYLGEDSLYKQCKNCGTSRELSDWEQISAPVNNPHYQTGKAEKEM